MSHVVSINLTTLAEALLEGMAKKTGLSRSEIIRRMIIAHSAGHPADTLLPDAPKDGRATTVWKEMTR